MKRRWMAALGIILEALVAAGGTASAECFRYSTGPLHYLSTPLQSLDVSVLNNDGSNSLTATVTEYAFPTGTKQVSEELVAFAVSPLALGELSGQSADGFHR